MFTSDRDTMRRQFREAWQKFRDGTPTTPLESMIGRVVADHPEYQPLLDDPDAVPESDRHADADAANPFLHMGLHLALREQVSTDRPPGVRAVHAALTRALGDPLQAEHRMMEPLAATLWEAQRSGNAPDETRYLEALRRLAPRSAR